MDQAEKVRNILTGRSLDAVLISDGYNMRYISGFSGGDGYVYLTHQRKVILTDSRYTIQAEEESNGFEILEVNGAYEDVLCRLLAEDNVLTLGFEAEDIRYNDYIRFRDALGSTELVPVGDELTRLRCVKEAWELDRIQKAEQIGDLAFDKILNIIKPGMTELEVAAHLEFIMKEKGAERLSFDTIAASGVHSAMPHAVPTDKRIEPGDFLTMDFGCVYQGYCSDMTRTIVVGKADRKQKEVYRTVLEAQTAALSYIRAGLTGRDIDRAARDIIYRAGYEGCFGHGLGHSVGLFIHENPRLSPREDAVLQAGMIETVEPGIYIRGFGGVRIEDLVVVTEDGCINFTGSPKELIEL